MCVRTYLYSRITNMAKLKVEKKLPRNSLVLAMNMRYHGDMSHYNHKDKRGGDKNEQQEYLQDIEDDQNIDEL